ncbi:MAG TPA: hypothetical protein VMA72_18660 [Streptosporangiaceae bacterium]|nr:hypothetical protein [Streptosporangiaceae bacterium]
MDEPEPLPAFTFSPDGPTTITYADGTVSVNAPRPGDPAVMPAAPDEPVTATQAAAAPGSVFPPEAPEGSQREVTVADPEPSGDSAITAISKSAAGAGAPADAPGVSEPVAWAAPAADAQVDSEPQARETAPVAAPPTGPQAWGAPTATADATASDSVINPDGSITTRLPDGSTQTVVRLPGGATIVTSTTRPGAAPHLPSAEPQRSRRWRGRGK